MKELVYYNESQYVTFDIPDEGAIGVFISGGADSTIMTHIVADIIVKRGLKTKVFPITCENLARPYNLRHARDVLDRIQNLTKFQFDLHLCFVIPNQWRQISNQEKELIQSQYTRSFMQKYNLSYIFNGLTANPPLVEFPESEGSHREWCRDDLAWRKKQEETPGLRVPFIHSDKKVIGQLYKKFNLIDSLFMRTRSCEGELEETAYFTKDCFDFRKPGEECWWCRERKYGFSEYHSFASEISL